MKIKVLILLASLFISMQAYAEQYAIVVGETLKLDGVTGADTGHLTVMDGRSYCCQITSAKFSSTSFAGLTVNGGTISDLTSQGNINPWMRNGNNARRCFNFHDSPPLGNGRGDITLDFSMNGTVNNVQVLCSDTSLYGGFNTVVTDFNYIEVTNTLTAITGTNENGTLKVNVKARGTSGNEVLSTSFNLEAGKRFDVDVHSSAQNDFGPVTITHNGPPGAIRAVNAQYRIVSQDPFDFEPVLVVPFREGKQ